MATKKSKRPIRIFHRKLGRENAHGQAWVDRRIIEIDERITGKEYFETCVHEIIHCQNPKWPEITVNARAKEMTELLWGLGFRWVDLHKK